MYNGYKNRQTWVVSLYFAEEFYEYVQDLPEETKKNPHTVAELLEDYLTEYIMELVDNNNFIMDLIDLGSIDWLELAEHTLEG